MSKDPSKRHPLGIEAESYWTRSEFFKRSPTLDSMPETNGSFWDAYSSSKSMKGQWSLDFGSPSRTVASSTGIQLPPVLKSGLPKWFTERSDLVPAPPSPIEVGTDWTYVDLTSKLSKELQPFGGALDIPEFSSILNPPNGSRTDIPFAMHVTCLLQDVPMSLKRGVWQLNGTPRTDTPHTRWTFQLGDSEGLWVPPTTKKYEGWLTPKLSSPTKDYKFQFQARYEHSLEERRREIHQYWTMYLWSTFTSMLNTYPPGPSEEADFY